MSGLRIGITTQTPLLRPNDAPATVSAVVGFQRRAVQVQHGPFHLSPGGVSRMALQEVRHWHASGWARQAHWFSLQPKGPEHVDLPEYGLKVHHLRLSEDEMRAYARTKERLWADIHGLDSAPFDIEDFRFYARYNWSTGDAVMAHAPDIDAIYVHDFQLLQVGAIIGLTAPSVLRWHVPFDAQRIPRSTRHFVLRLMEDFDGVVVSTRRDLQGLTNAGFRGKVLQEYPHTDLRDWLAPRPADTLEFEARAGIPPDAPVVLCVARMDPMKRQDVLIRAMALLRARHPDARTVLVGNGSFSGSSGGLGLSKSTLWRQELERTARDLRVQDRVSFTGWLPDRLVTAAYARADVLVLPSDIEGFGLTPFEAWAYRKPCIVSSGCGSAEVIQDGVHGYTFPPGDDRALAARLDAVLSRREEAERIGEAGRTALRTYDVQNAAPRIAAFIEESMARARRTA